MTNNGATLDAGTYTLNSYGYFEDVTVQLPGGTNSVKAQYAGDNSFNGSSVTSPLSITSAGTTFALLSISSEQVGVSFTVQGTISTQSSGAGPTGSVTFYEDGAAVSGNAILSPVAATSTSLAYTQVISPPLSFSTGGTHSISAQYSGDANYSGQTATAIQILLNYPAPNVSLSASAQTVNAGTTVTLTTLVDTTIAGPVPTGTVSFVDLFTGVAIPGTVTSTPGTDSHGNPDLQATLTYTPAADQEVQSTYSGDSNYPSTGSDGIFLTVTGSDFSFTSATASVIVSPGQTAGMNLFIEGQSGYNGTVNFSPSSCSGLPSESTCSFNSLAISGQGEVSLSITTTAAGAENVRPAKTGLGFFMMTGPLLLGGFVLLGTPLFGRRRAKWILAFVTIAFTVMLAACGGGGSSSSGPPPNPGTTAGTYSVTVTATSGSGSSAITHTATFNLVVQ